MGKDLMMSSCVELSNHSPPIIISHEDRTKHKKYGSLNLFEHASLPDGGGVLFAGGSLSAFDWHPTAHGICVLAANRLDQPTHLFSQLYHGLSHLQLWKLSLEGASFLGLISHQGNCVWDIKWRPSNQLINVDNNHQWTGCFAAALGNGTVVLYEFGDFDQPKDVDFERNPDVQQLPNARVETLRHATSEMQPCRTLAWSPDGTRLIAGNDNGDIEIYERSPRKGTWCMWSLPAQSNSVTGISWFSNTHFCTVSVSGTLRIHDIRNPASILEQVIDGLEGAMFAASIEPHVAAVGCDGGVMRIVRTSGIDGRVVVTPVKRAYLQSSPIRCIDSVSVKHSGVVTDTIVYAAGSEGLVHEIILPRPIWTETDRCHIGLTNISRKMRWTVELDKQNESDEEIQKDENCLSEFLHLLIGEAASKDKEDPCGKHPDVPVNATLTSQLPPSKSKRRKIANVAYLTGREGRYIGDLYKDKISIRFSKICKKGEIIAIGNQGGVLVWIPTDLEKRNLDKASEQDHDRARELGMETVGEMKKRLQRHKSIVNATENGPIAANGSVSSKRTNGKDSSKKESPVKKSMKQTKPVFFGPQKKLGRPKKTSGKQSRALSETDEKTPSPDKKLIEIDDVRIVEKTTNDAEGDSSIPGADQSTVIRKSRRISSKKSKTANVDTVNDGDLLPPIELKLRIVPPRPGGTESPLQINDETPLVCSGTNTPIGDLKGHDTSMKDVNSDVTKEKPENENGKLLQKLPLQLKLRIRSPQSTELTTENKQ